MTSSEVPARLPILRPFANNGTKDVIPDETGDFMNITQGFPSVYGVPASSGGKYVSRSDMNSIGFMATNDLFYHKCGGLNTFDANFSEKVGGYPQGAVLQYLNGRYLYNVISLHDNNTFNFVAENSINGVDWAYCNEVMASSDKILALESSVSLYCTAGLQQTLLGVFKAQKNGTVIADVTLSPVRGDGISSTTGSVRGCGIFIKDLGTSYISVPVLNKDTISQWTMLASVCGNFDVSVGNMYAQFGHYYAVTGLLSSILTFPTLDENRYTLASTGQAANHTFIYIQ